MSGQPRPHQGGKEFVLVERSDVDPHQKLDSDVLGEHLGEGFFLSGPVLVERDRRGAIKRTTPLEELTPEQLRAGSTDPKVVDELPARKPRTQDQRQKAVEMMAGHLLTWYASKKPGQVPYNPLYDGIPIEAALDGAHLLDPKDKNGLVHVSATEVHEWLRQVLGKRMDIVNTRTRQRGWQGDIGDLAVRIKR